MGCILWVQLLTDILPHFPQWCVQYHVVLDRVITALDCLINILQVITQANNSFVILNTLASYEGMVHMSPNEVYIFSLFERVKIASIDMEIQRIKVNLNIIADKSYTYV